MLFYLSVTPEFICMPIPFYLFSCMHAILPSYISYQSSFTICLHQIYFTQFNASPLAHSDRKYLIKTYYYSIMHWVSDLTVSHAGTTNVAQTLVNWNITSFSNQWSPGVVLIVNTFSTTAYLTRCKRLCMVFQFCGLNWKAVKRPSPRTKAALSCSANFHLR